MFRLRRCATDGEKNITKLAHIPLTELFSAAASAVVCPPPVEDASLSNLMNTGGRSPGSLANVIVAVVPPELQTVLSTPENATTTGGVEYSAASDYIA